MRLMAGVLLIAVSMVSAQAQPEFERRDFGRWHVICLKGGDKPHDCGIQQAVFAATHREAWIRARVRFDVGNRPELFFIVSPKAAERKTLHVEFGDMRGKMPISMPLSCDEKECETRSRLGEETLARILQSEFLSVEFSLDEHQGMKMGLVTDGLQQALDSLKK
jgi:invasion protein IalB